jgi:hypothetical protein
MLARDENPELFWVRMLLELLWTVVQRERLGSNILSIPGWTGHGG